MIQRAHLLFKYQLAANCLPNIFDQQNLYSRFLLRKTKCIKNNGEIYVIRTSFPFTVSL